MSAYDYYEIKAIQHRLDDLESGCDEYRQIHKLAKIIVCLFITGLIYFSNGALYANMLIIPIWFFGVNTIAYGLETLFRLKHRHDKF